MKKTDIVKNKVKFLIIPILIILAGIVFFFVHNGFNFDIEFMGGIRMQVDMAQEFNNKEVAQTIKDKTGVDVVVQKTGGNTQAIIKTPPLEEAKKTEIYSALKEKYNLQADSPMSTSSATASFGHQVQQKTLLYTLIAILLILVYIAIRFEWRSAIMAVIALAINILVMFSVYSIAYVPLNTTFIAAMLTVVGYSINNTIVVFDRIRENMKTAKGRSVLDVTNDSIWQSMGRTINTTITTLITILLLYIIGVESIKQFAFPLIVGVLAGAYSSIFIASPFWATWKESDRLAKIEEARLNAASKKKKK
jgi:preprotein translocase subunit SecF